MRTTVYEIAGFAVRIAHPGLESLYNLLPSFRPFKVEEEVGNPLIDITLHCKAEERSAGGELLQRTVNDMGSLTLYGVDGGTLELEVRAAESSPAHLMRSDRDFSRVDIFVEDSDTEAGRMLSSMLRVAYSQAILKEGAFALHASAVVLDGRSYLFLGKSGTGKSTHSELWRKVYPSCTLLNDDNPVIRSSKGKVYAGGSPWSGKTPCYKAQSFPVAGMVSLRQSEVNAFSLLDGSDAFAVVYQGSSLVSADPVLRERLYDAIALAVSGTRVARLDCRPDEGAAILCHDGLDSSAESGNVQVA